MIIVYYTRGFRSFIITIVLLLMCITTSAIIAPFNYETDSYMTPPQHIGNFSGCTKKIYKIKKPKKYLITIHPFRYYYKTMLDLALIIAHVTNIHSITNGRRLYH